MIHIFLNGLGASAGSGLTYLYNVLPPLSADTTVHTTLAVQPQLRREFAEIPNVTLLELDVPFSTAGRFWFEQRKLPELICDSRADVLISAGNFAVRTSPVPQILLSGNSLYTSSDFSRDLWRRREFGMLFDNKIKAVFAKRSVHWADCTVAPSQAFADDLKKWTGRTTLAVHHGFDRELFFCDASPLPDNAQRALSQTENCLKLLFVSHYNYYRNFETLFKALPLIREALQARKVRLFLTCALQDGKNPGTYRTGKAAALIRQLGISEEVVELGAVPYRQLHHVYRACDIYVTPAYTETFAHPLVEAMASGLPIVASDLPVHREVCGDAALYFSTFSPAALCDEIISCSTTLGTVAARKRAQLRADRFSWAAHVENLISRARYMLQDGHTYQKGA